jgi:quinol monooxygenase YgiN
MSTDRGTKPTVLVIGSFRLPPHQVEAAMVEMTPMIMASRAESGCLEYVYAEDLAEPGLIHVKERWRDRAALRAHFSTPHLLKWRAAFGALGVSERRLVLHRIGRGDPV